ncbi:MAG TPA: small ribosomal subunit Rsm22 family protein [Opitutaceae bacterium]|jgi:ribosomal protein RSM22 (predicted rRNA methylase)|nr:small ribosomal subunit Rsm22 family protein [Opitutaceae bacterium]
MELPAALRRAVDGAIAGAAPDELARAAQALSLRYRGETRDGRFHVADALSAQAYAAVRLPATYAAVRESLQRVAEAAPEFAPATVIDAGAGPGTATWAAAECWPSVQSSTLIEGSPAFRALGETLARDGLAPALRWRGDDLLAPSPDLAPADLALLGYVLGELAPEARGAVVDRLWQATAGTLVIVEPGTPAGWERVLAARDRLLQAGAHLLAPCPHAARCPLAPPDWCHFARRVARSRIHLQTKHAAVPWEDEKYIFIAAGRSAGRPAGARVIAPPRSASGQVWLKLCRSDGTAGERHFTRREGDAFKAARRAEWGESL